MGTTVTTLGVVSATASSSTTRTSLTAVVRPRATGEWKKRAVVSQNRPSETFHASKIASTTTTVTCPTTDQTATAGVTHTSPKAGPTPSAPAATRTTESN